MSKNKSPISQATSYQEIADFWDTHDLSDYWIRQKKLNSKWILNPRKLTIAWKKSFRNKWKKSQKIAESPVALL